MKHTKILGEHTVGERIFDFDCCATAGELAVILKGFTGVDIGGNGSLGYFNAKADWNIDIRSSEHTPPSVKYRRWFENQANPHSTAKHAPMRDIVHHQSPASGPLLFLLPPACDFEGVGSGVTAFQTTVRDENSDGKAFERFVMTNSTARASRLFRSRRAASLRRGLRKSRKVRLLVVIVSVELDRVARGSLCASARPGPRNAGGSPLCFLCFLIFPNSGRG